MSDTFEETIRDVMSGEARGVLPTLARVALRAAETAYAGVASTRNALFDRAMLRSRRLPRPVISIGNLTTGGTGKTPAVQWLVGELRSQGRRPAVLMRGYRRLPDAAASDEEQLLRDSLAIPVVANADRYRGGCDALKADPTIDVFVLDDGFQHRRLARDVDVVLIDATNPFGYGHVLPRGMLREKISGLSRAHLVLLTRCDLVDAASLAGIEQTIRRHHANVPIIRTAHVLGAIRGQQTFDAVQAIGDRRVFAFSGIGNPAAFEASLTRAGVTLAGSRRFADHHHYTSGDVALLLAAGQDVRADLLLTTEKDWTKIGSLVGGAAMPFAWVGLRLTMDDSARQLALETINRRLLEAAASP